MYSREKRQLQNGFDAIAPDLLENICQKEFVKVESEEELFSDLSNKKEKIQRNSRHQVLISGMVAVAACFLCLVLFGKQENVRNRIILDINPSISIWLDDENQVTKVEALNEDGKEILDEFPEMKNLDETVTEILKRLVERKYLQQDKASVLVTYAYESGVVPQEQVKKIVDAYLETENEQVTVIYQEIEAKEEEEKNAKEQGVSVGKYHFIQKLKKDHDLNANELYDKNMEEIVKNASDKGVDLKREGTAGSKRAEKQEKEETRGSMEEEIFEAEEKEECPPEAIESPKAENKEEKEEPTEDDTSRKNNRKGSKNKSQQKKENQEKEEASEGTEKEPEEIPSLPRDKKRRENKNENQKSRKEEVLNQRNDFEIPMNKYTLEKFPLK